MEMEVIMSWKNNIKSFIDLVWFKDELSEAEAADYIGKSVSTLRAYRGKRIYKRVPDLPYQKRGRKYFYKKSDLNDWLKVRG